MTESGSVISIYISPEKGVPMQELEAVRVIPGRGLEGDRYEKGVGAYSVDHRIPQEDRGVTIISRQAIDEANNLLAEKKVAPFSPAETRRNIVVDMDPKDLNALVGQRFKIGNVEMEGAELCDPCKRPSNLLSRKDGKEFVEAFTNRGGLRVRVTTDGIIMKQGVIQPLS